ncbi:hypothetical protein D9M68_318730 [compost metagenome]
MGPVGRKTGGPGHCTSAYGPWGRNWSGWLADEDACASAMSATKKGEAGAALLPSDASLGIAISLISHLDEILIAPLARR